LTLFYTSKVEMHWIQVITNEAPPYTLITMHNLYEMNKFLCIYQSPYYLSVDKAFSVLHIQNVYLFQRNNTLSYNKQ
jgi:hypothetical protein